MISYTRYNYSTDEGSSVEFLEISNAWSYKNVRFIFSDAEGTTLWTLKNKCNFVFYDEFDTKVTEKDLPDCFENFPMELVHWINRKIIEHLDFLVGKAQLKKEEKLSSSIESNEK